MCGVRACTCIQPLKRVPHARVPRSYRPRGSVFKYLYESSPRWFRITRAHIKSPEHCCPRARAVIVGYHRIRSQRYFIKPYTRLQLFYTHVVVDVVQYLWVNVASVFAAPSNFQSNREILCLAYATSSFCAHAVFERRSVGFVSVSLGENTQDFVQKARVTRSGMQISSVSIWVLGATRLRKRAKLHPSQMFDKI